jgi:hypothetical protein
MKKLYFLDEEEKNRILNLHEGATKNQYLKESNSLISEGYYNTVDLKNLTLTLNSYLEMERDGSGSELRLEKGVVFKRENALGLIASNVNYSLVGDYTGGEEEKGKGNIRYTCKTKKFSIEGRNATFFGENFATETTKNFDDLCGAIGVTTSSIAACVKQFNGTDPLPAKTPGFVYIKGNESTLFFSKDFEFRYRYEKSGKLVVGNWSCKQGILKLTLPDDSWTKATGWASNKKGKVSSDTVKDGSKTVKQNLTPNIQAVQKQLGIENGTGTLDTATLQAMLAKLNGGQVEAPAAAPQQTVSSVVPAGVVPAGSPASAQLAQLGQTPQQMQQMLNNLSNRPQ